MVFCEIVVSLKSRRPFYNYKSQSSTPYEPHQSTINHRKTWTLPYKSYVSTESWQGLLLLPGRLCTGTFATHILQIPGNEKKTCQSVHNSPCGEGLRIQSVTRPINSVGTSSTGTKSQLRKQEIQHSNTAKRRIFWIKPHTNMSGQYGTVGQYFL